MRKQLLVSGLIFLSFVAQAGTSPIGISLVHKIGFPPPNYSVTGVRTSLFWGVHRQVYGLDIGGLGNVTLQDFGGVAISGGVNSNHGTTHILLAQIAGVANLATGSAKLRVLGIQFAGLINSAQAESSVVGMQIAGLANLAPYATIGFLQLGAYNQARRIYGFQIGLINSVEELHGIQIGLLNFNRTGLFAVAPFLNVGF